MGRGFAGGGGGAVDGGPCHISTFSHFQFEAGGRGREAMQSALELHLSQLA